MADPQWRIRDATEADLPALARLMADAPLLERYATTSASALEALQQAFAERDVLLVLEPVGETTGSPRDVPLTRIEAPSESPRGMAWLIFTRAFDHAAYLRLLLLAEDAQGAGAGQRLMAEIEQRARANARHVYFMVTRDNAGARRFYERLGFRAVGDLPAHVRPDLDEVLYHKPLR